MHLHSFCGNWVTNLSSEGHQVIVLISRSLGACSLLLGSFLSYLQPQSSLASRELNIRQLSEYSLSSKCLNSETSTKAVLKAEEEKYNCL